MRTTTDLTVAEKLAVEIWTEAVDAGRHIACQFIWPYDYDTQGVSCIIQVAAFGEILFD